MIYSHIKIILFGFLFFLGNAPIYGFSVEYNEAPKVEQKRNKKKLKKAKQNKSKTKKILLATSLIYSIAALGIVLVFAAVGSPFTWLVWLIVSVLLIAALVSLIWGLLLNSEK